MLFLEMFLTKTAIAAFRKCWLFCYPYLTVNEKICKLQRGQYPNQESYN